jgi:AraC-like DNA-binding protein
LSINELIVFIFIIGAAQGFLLFVFLLRKKENPIANKILSFTMLAFSIDLLAGVGYVGKYYFDYPQLIGSTAVFPYLYGPAIYLYVFILGNKKEGFKKIYLLHFLPFLLLNIYGIFFYYFEPPEFKLQLLDFNYQASWHLELVGKLIPFHGCIYIFFTIRETFKFNRKLKASYSNIEQISLNWIRFVVLGAAIIWFIVVFAYILNFIFGEEIQANILIYVGMSVLIYSIGYKSLKQPEVILIEENLTKLNGKSSNEKFEKSYKKSGLTDETAEKQLEILLKLMDEKKPYINSKLKLADLSELLKISTHNLSEVLNKKLRQNFYDFINSYRVKEVKRLIAEDKNNTLSILAIGYDAGFSSKSAFYSAFKKVNGITPAQYRDELHKKAAS